MMFSCLKYKEIAINQDDKLLMLANKNDYKAFYKFGYF